MRSSDTLAAIKSAILLAPESVRNGSASVQEIYLNTPISQTPKVYAHDLVRRDDLVRAMAIRGLFSKLSIDLLKMIELSELIDTQNSGFQDQLDELVVSGAFKSDDVEAIDTLGKYEVLVSPAVALGLGEVTIGEVEEAIRS